MKAGITLWKMEFLNPKPLSPVQRSLKFSAVLGTICENSSMVMTPSGSSSAATLRNTRGLLSLECSWILDIWWAEALVESPLARPMFCWHLQKTFLKDSAMSALLNLAASCSTTPLPSDLKTRTHKNIKLSNRKSSKSAKLKRKPHDIRVPFLFFLY